MTRSFRIVDLRNSGQANEIVVAGAASPEKAAMDALGVPLHRSGSKSELAARVYWQPADQPMNMVRLYTRVPDQRAR